jgi:hypothetical protein
MSRAQIEIQPSFIEIIVGLVDPSVCTGTRAMPDGRAWLSASGRTAVLGRPAQQTGDRGRVGPVGMTGRILALGWLRGHMVSRKFIFVASVPSPTGVSSRHIVNVCVYNKAGSKGPMYSAPSPYDEPTKPIDVQHLRAWWVHQRNEAQATDLYKPAPDHWPRVSDCRRDEFDK